MMAIVVRGDALNPEQIQKAFDQIEEVDAVVSTIGGTPADPTADSQVPNTVAVQCQEFIAHEFIAHANELIIRYNTWLILCMLNMCVKQNQWLSEVLVLLQAVLCHQSSFWCLVLMSSWMNCAAPSASGTGAGVWLMLLNITCAVLHAPHKVLHCIA